MSIEQGMRKSKEIGFDAYDIFEDALDLDDATREMIKSVSEEIGLPIRSQVCVNFGLVDFNPAVQNFALDRTRAAISQASFLGGRNVLLVLGEYYWDGEVFPNEAIWDIAVGNLKTLAADAEKAGIDLVIELEPFTQALVKDVHELARFIREVGSPRVKANADISHLHLSGASFDDVAELNGMIGHAHVSDCDGKVHGDLPPGRGVTPIKEYLAAAVDAGFTDGTVSLELEYSPDPDNIVPWVEEAYRELAVIMDELDVR
jgi:sugar phosphate isomerase/epimerase